MVCSFGCAAVGKLGLTTGPANGAAGFWQPLPQPLHAPTASRIVIMRKNFTAQIVAGFSLLFLLRAAGRPLAPGELAFQEGVGRGLLPS